MSGFAVRLGLTGAGVTVLLGRNYFGIWRATSGSLAWRASNGGDQTYFAHSVEDAARHTMRLILRYLQDERAHAMDRAAELMTGNVLAAAALARAESRIATGSADAV